MNVNFFNRVKLGFYGGVLLTLAVGACNKTDCGDPAPDYLLLHIQDSDSNNLIGTTYVGESFDLYNADTVIKVGPEPYGADYLLSIFPGFLISDTPYFLKLSESDIDTLEITWHLAESGCYTYHHVTNLRYNDVFYSGSGYIEIFKED